MRYFGVNLDFLKFLEIRGTPALHLNEPKRIIDGFNGLIADLNKV